MIRAARAATAAESRVSTPNADAAGGGDASFETVDITIRGLVQGVGFRPFVHRLALRHHVSGWVRNEAAAVRALATGRSSDVCDFLASLRDELPPLARIDTLIAVPTEEVVADGFRVEESDVSPTGRLPVSPDVATCAACASEVRDPTDRRFRYPFITCTDCGPRFTVIEAMPYDRERSTMRAFDQCPTCAEEYASPADRRYHSETNSCPDCGPTVWLERSPTDRPAAAPARPERRHSDRLEGLEAIGEAGRRLRAGEILAVRGLGGFHLAADAGCEVAVLALRSRKGREAKPMAVMVRELEDAWRLAHVSEAEARLLASRERPIVVLRLREEAPLAPSVSPGLNSVGLMLAYTPLHHLLLDAAGGRPLVMTSGNLSEEPIATGNEEARHRLGRVADSLLLHDREIVARYDDSLARVVDGSPLFLRRSRGYAPMPLSLPVRTARAILAVGPHLKNTFTLAQGASAYVSQHIGDLENLETLEHFQDALERFRTLFRIDPELVVHDLHPGYLSTRIAEESGLSVLPPIQHHHAHVAAVAAEHGVTGRVLGLAFDGTGLGADGRIWGCELLEADLVDYRRVAHLRYVPLPGGDLAARTPWRSLLGYASLDPSGAWAARALASAPPPELRMAERQIERRLNAPLASSLGRLFDAAACLLGIRSEAAYEGQAAMELEAVAGLDEAAPLPFPELRSDDEPRVLDPVPLLETLSSERARGARVEELAARFHESVIRAAADLALDVCRARGLERVALGGGCFQNARLLSGVRRALSAAGVDVLVPPSLGPNDGAISYGQAVIAAARLRDEEGGV